MGRPDEYQAKGFHQQPDGDGRGINQRMTTAPVPMRMAFGCGTCSWPPGNTGGHQEQAGIIKEEMTASGIAAEEGNYHK